MKNNLMWGYLAHLGYNMWADMDAANIFEGTGSHDIATDYLQFERETWSKVSDKLAKGGCNTIILDIGEGMIYESHPELAIKGSWTKKEVADELSRLRSLGFEVIPKLNFSSSHDEWMGKYSRMVSTPEYYKVCDDVIDEVCELFGNPRLFHLGMDEEVASVQQGYTYTVIREGNLYWHDQNRLFKRVEKNGARPWIWADYIWHTKKREKMFLENMTKDVLCSIWYYRDFKVLNDWHDDCWNAYELLEKHGFDQLPAGSNVVMRENLEHIINHSKKTISPEHLEGFLITTWKAMRKENEGKVLETADIINEAAEKYKNGIYN